jgi:cytochrome P450
LIWGDDVNEFKPERFYPENFKRIDPHVFQPFNHGPRMCIGHNYARLLMKISIANIVRSFQIKTKLKFDELEFRLAILLRIKQNYMVELVKRRQ